LSVCAVGEVLQRQFPTFPVPAVPTPTIRTPPDTLQRLSRTYKVRRGDRVGSSVTQEQAHCVRMASAYSAHLQETVHAQEMWKARREHAMLLASLAGELTLLAIARRRPTRRSCTRSTASWATRW
jgi:hypothetical protein